MFIILCFIWGAGIATTMAYVLETMLASHILDFFILSVLIAPVVEEFAKPLGLRFAKKEIDEIEDGLIFGAVAGIGFAATENLLYGIRFWDQGFIVLFSLFYLRTVGSALLHASATALTGYGYSAKLLHKRSFISVLPFFFLAIVIHGLFNLFAFSAQTVNQIFGIAIATLFAVTLIIWIRKKITVLDQRKIKLKRTLSVDKI
jgi:RsiW-degrading membrane proteinase PrsW (M82 family)